MPTAVVSIAEIAEGIDTTGLTPGQIRHQVVLVAARHRLVGETTGVRPSTLRVTRRRRHNSGAFQPDGFLVE